MSIDCRGDGGICHEPNGGCQGCPRSPAEMKKKDTRFMDWYCGGGKKAW